MNLQAIKAGESFKTALEEVMQGKNLGKHDKDVTNAIQIVQNKIKEAASEGLPAVSLCEVERHLNFLKIQIEQRQNISSN